MKHFNNIKLLSSFRQILSALEIVSSVLKVFVFVSALLQVFLLIKETTDTVKNIKVR